jgi:hypothetical protein
MLIRIRISIFGADTDPEWHQNDADPHADPTPNFKEIRKQGEKNLFFFSHQWQ